MSSLQELLVVDDEPSLVQLCEIVLKGAGFAVRIAYGGKQASNLVETKRPDLILLDVMMPGMDGIEVCKQVRDAHDKHPYIVMYTADDRDSTRRACMNAGANHVLTKETPVFDLPKRLQSLADSFDASTSNGKK